MIITFIYIALLNAVAKSKVRCRKQIEVIKRKKSFRWSKLMYLPHSFWLIASMEFLLGGGWGCFLHINRLLFKLICHSLVLLTLFKLVNL